MKKLSTLTLICISMTSILHAGGNIGYGTYSSCYGPQKDCSERYFYKTKPCKGDYYWRDAHSKKYKGTTYFINYKRKYYKSVDKYRKYSRDLEVNYNRQRERENIMKDTL